MARLQVRTDTISPDIRIDVTDKFPSLKTFYEVAGLTMSLEDLYIVMRGELHTPEMIVDVEQGYLRAMEIMNMGPKQVLKVIQGKIDELGAEGGKNLDKLREIAGRLLYI